MSGKVHIAAGVAVGVALYYGMDANIYEAVTYAVVGSVLPDIDEEHSTINNWLFGGIPTWIRALVKVLIGAGMFAAIILMPTLLVGYRYYVMYAAGVILISGLSSLFTKVTFQNHRSILHDPLLGSIILLAPLFYLFQRDIAFFATLGVWSHYLLDALTPEGLPLMLTGKNLRWR